MSAVPPPQASSITVELCAETPEACAAGEAGGVHRIEFCTALDVGGLTPSLELVRTARAHTTLPMHVLLRPTAETFAYSPAVFEALRSALLATKDAGADGFVLGLLTAGQRVDVEHTRALVALADPLPVTFHRAFDELYDLPQGLRDVIATGCTRVLTSGGAPDVVAGAGALAALVQQAGDRIDVAAGGGLRLGNAALVAAETQARHFHASLREPEPLPLDRPSTLTERARALVHLLTEVQPAESSLYTTAGTGAVFSTSRAGR